MRSTAEKGVSLVEMLLVASIIGTLMLMLAPVERFLLGKLREGMPSANEGLQLALSASLLTEDVRLCRAMTVEPAGRAVFDLAEGERVVWEQTEAGLVRRASGSRAFPAVSRFACEVVRVDLFSARLATRGGERRQISAWARNAGGNR